MITKNQIKLVRQLELKKHRQREGLFVAEGPKVVGDLLAAGYSPVHLFATPQWQGPVAATAVSDDELRRLSFLQHPQQVLAVFPLPEGHDVPPGERVMLALDGVQDPGNVGTIIRVADWFGIGTIVCSPDTADAWAPKVVQATMGSIARVRMVYTDMETFLASVKLPVMGTVLDGDDIYTADLPREGVIVMGNEGNGISEPVRALLTQRLLIPRFRPGAESLNVSIATAIACSEFCRRRNL